jgi:hypothetical protein
MIFFSSLVGAMLCTVASALPQGRNTLAANNPNVPTEAINGSKLSTSPMVVFTDPIKLGSSFQSTQLPSKMPLDILSFPSQIRTHHCPQMGFQQGCTQL